MKEQEDLLQDIYEEARNAFKESRGSIMSHLRSESLSEAEKKVNIYLRLIIFRGAPFKIITDKEYRKFLRHISVTSAATVKMKTINLMEMVKHRIRKEIESKKGAELSDGWSKRVVHYVDMIIYYMKEVPVREEKSNATKNIQKMALMELSPMEKTIFSR